jgi:predicted negative regulator of RcsB-dependent stress response
VPLNADDAELKYAELFDRYKRHLGWLGIVIVLIGGGTWFYLRSQSLKSQHAETAYEAAMQSVQSGNIPLAQSDLKKAAARYAGTAGGTESAMALAKTYYQQGKFQDGIDALKPATTNGGDLQYEAILLSASGYEAMAKWKEAAAAYESAASAARFDADKTSARAMAAKAYQAAGDKAAAVKIWTDLLADPSGLYTTEARIRLGELQAAPAKA